MKLKLTHVPLDRFAVFGVYVDVLAFDLCGQLTRQEEGGVSVLEIDEERRLINGVGGRDDGCLGVGGIRQVVVRLVNLHFLGRLIVACNN